MTIPKLTVCSLLLLFVFAHRVTAQSVGCDWAEVLAEYDVNKDGRLDAKEREILRISRPMGFTCDPGRGTWDPNRYRSSSRSGGANEARPAHPIAKFDTNGNGRLEAAELAAARQTIARREANLKNSKSDSDSPAR